MINDDIRVSRVAGILIANPNMRFHRGDLARVLSTVDTQLSLRSITRVWPGIEARVVRKGLFPVRPIGRLRYGVAACRDPLPALLSMTYRERGVLTRFNKDLSGRVLQRLSVSEDAEVAELASMQLQRIRTYVAAAERDGLDAWRLEMKALDAYRSLGWARFSAGRTYARDEPVRAVRTG